MITRENRTGTIGARRTAGVQKERDSESLSSVNFGAMVAPFACFSMFMVVEKGCDNKEGLVGFWLAASLWSAIKTTV